jgi:hypothetical protein
MISVVAALESNILKSMSQGVLPGGASPTQKAKALTSSMNNIPAPASNPRSPKTKETLTVQLSSIIVGSWIERSNPSL